VTGVEQYIPKIIAIPGSTRKVSSNRSLINAIGSLFRGQIELVLYDGLDKLPHFNPDVDNEKAPAPVNELRKALKESDGILICTPEYAMGVPGSLKNAVDWTVSSMEFSHKPVALITASSQGEKAHASLMETLRIVEADLPPANCLLIQFVSTKVKNEAITDPQTQVDVISTINSLLASVAKSKAVKSQS
jgi:chromate reductase, NAD(P)H dehydrogenase (quinone)